MIKIQNEIKQYKEEIKQRQMAEIQRHQELNTLTQLEQEKLKMEQEVKDSKV